VFVDFQRLGMKRVMMRKIIEYDYNLTSKNEFFYFEILVIELTLNKFRHKESLTIESNKG
jgi:hypothetical protein